MRGPGIDDGADSDDVVAAVVSTAEFLEAPALLARPAEIATLSARLHVAILGESAGGFARPHPRSTFRHTQSYSAQ